MCLQVFLADEPVDADDAPAPRGGGAAAGRRLPEDQLPARPRRRLDGARPQLLPGHRPGPPHRAAEARPGRRHRLRPRRRRRRHPGPAGQLPPRHHRGARAVRRAERPHPRDARAELLSRRVSVPTRVKLAILARATVVSAVPRGAAAGRTASHRPRVGRTPGAEAMTGRRVVVIGGGHRRSRDGGAARTRGLRGHAAGAEADARRPRGLVAARRLPLRHRPVLVPDAGGLRPLLPAARHLDRRSSSTW